MIELKPNESVTPASALHVPIGVASPLWFMFTGAASAGVAYWWMTRWMRPINLKAMLPVPRAGLAPVEDAAVLAEALVAPVVEAADVAAGVVDPDPAPMPAPEPAPNPLDTPPAEAAAAVMEAVVEPVLQAAPPASEPARKPIAAKPKVAPKT